MTPEESMSPEGWEANFLREDYFAQWAEIIYNDLLEDNPAEVSLEDIESAIKKRFPEVCDDRVSCSHTSAPVPEWKHQIRNVLTRLGKRGLARAVRRGYWVRFENYDNIPLV